MDNTFIRAEDVVWRKIGDEIVVIKDDGLSVHLLNKTAAVIWEAWVDISDPEGIASALCERFDVSFDEAKCDIENTVAQMKEIGLMKQREEVFSR